MMKLKYKYQAGGKRPSFLNQLRSAGNNFGTQDVDYGLTSLNLLASIIADGKLNSEAAQYQEYWQRQMSLPTQLVNPQAYGNPYAMKKGGINIKPENKGKFTAWARNHGMSVSEAASKVMSAPEGKYSSSVRKMANFARNAKKFKHDDGGEICWECIQNYSNPLMYPNFPQMQNGGVIATTAAQQRGGYFMYPNASSITFPGSGQRTFVPGPFPLLVQDSNGIQMLNQNPINTRGRVTEYPMFQIGGQVNFTAKPVSEEDATIEAEEGEYILGFGTPKNPFEENDSNIGVGLYKIGGNKHYNGGTKLAANPGDFIFSDDRRLAFSKDLAKDLIGKEIDKARLRTPAKLVGKYNKLNSFIDMAQDRNTTSIDRKTAILNTENILDKLADIAIGQEALKGFPTGIPEFAQASLDKRSAEAPDAEVDQMQPQQSEGMESFQFGGRSGSYDTTRDVPDNVYYIPPTGGVNQGYYPIPLPPGFRYPENSQNVPSISTTAPTSLYGPALTGPDQRVNMGPGDLYYTPRRGAQLVPSNGMAQFDTYQHFGGGRGISPVSFPLPPDWNRTQPNLTGQWYDYNNYVLPRQQFRPFEYGTPTSDVVAPPTESRSTRTTSTRTRGTGVAPFVSRPVTMDVYGSPDDVGNPFVEPNQPVVNPTIPSYNAPSTNITSRNYNSAVNPNIAELYGFYAANKRYAARYPTAQKNFELDNVDALLTSGYRPLSAQPYLNNIQRQLNTFTANNSGYGPVSYARNAYAFTQGLNAQQQAIGQVEQQNIQRQDQLNQALAQNSANKGQSRLQLQDKYLRELEQVKFNQENATKARMAQNSQLLNSYVNRAYSQRYANAMLDNFQFDPNGNITPVQGRSLKQAVLDSPAGNQMSSQLNYMEQLFRLMNRYGIRNGNFVDDFVKPITRPQ